MTVPPGGEVRRALLFGAGLLVGGAAGLLWCCRGSWTESGEDGSAASGAASADGRGPMARLWEEAADAFTWPRRPDGSREPLDLEALQARIDGLVGPERVRVRPLAPGIVELVGSVDRAGLAQRLLDEASRRDGVRIVVDRVWKPRSGSPDPTN